MMQRWFPDAKLGIFIHWGIYAVDGIDESWAFFNGKVTHEEYMRQLDGFTAKNWDPDAWCDLFKRAGARYVAMTTKHHDGVALWDTKANDLSVVKKTPAARDLITPYVQALRKAGLHVGFYYSHLDWSHPDYASIHSDDPNANAFAFTQEPTDKERWERFLGFHRTQIRELCTEFGPIDLLWFDGDWERDAETWRMKELRDEIHSMQPNVIINSRMQGYGDYATPEQGQPLSAPAGEWEFCVTMNNSWGYQGSDRNYKTPRQVLRMFCEVVGMGGNLLLDIGPMEDGTIPPEQVEILEFLGRWMAGHSESIYDTRAGLPAGHHYGPSTLSKDRSTLYLFLFDTPHDQVCLRGVRNKIERVTALGSGQELTFKRTGELDWLEVPGAIWIDVPAFATDEQVTVLKVELQGPLDLYSGAGRS
ncbi:MAG: alpha-L-fucosidase [Fimbriimonadaceae bacterium]|nr:alpha-L-fucosidase [Fimbriimonadaceae bacterium]